MEKVVTFYFLVFFATTHSQAQACSGGYAPNLPDCTTYLQCVNGSWLKRSCPSGLYWNGGGNYCDWPASSGCNPGGNPSPTTKSPNPVTDSPPSGGSGRLHKKKDNLIFLKPQFLMFTHSLGIGITRHGVTR